MGASALVPKGDTSGAKKKVIFNRYLFKYDKDQDLTFALWGNELPHKRNVKEGGIQLRSMLTTLLAETVVFALIVPNQNAAHEK